MKRYTTFALSLLVSLPLVASQWACGAQTAGNRVTYKTAFTGAVSQGASVKEFTNKRGWKIRLDEAKLLVGPIYFYAGEARASLFQRWFGVGIAAACTTHAQFNNGAILGEVQQQVVVNLLAAEPTKLGSIVGVEGHMNSMEVHLHPPGRLEPSKSMPELKGSTLMMIGKASNDNESVPFRVSFTIPDTGTMRIVESIASNVKLEEKSVKNGTLVVEVYLDKWFTNVDFSNITKTDKSGMILLDSDNFALLQGVRSRFAYGATWKK